MKKLIALLLASLLTFSAQAADQNDKSTFVEGQTRVNPLGCVLNESGATSPGEDTAYAVRCTTNRAMHVNLRTAAGVELLGQKTMAGSVPIVIASDQSSIPISGTLTGTVDIGNFPNNEPFNLTQIDGATILSGNGVTGSGSPRVTIASDQTAFSVNAVQLGAWSSRITDGTDTATVLNLAGEDPLAVAIVDASGNQITSFGGGSGGTSSSFGSAFPSTGTAQGFTDGTNMQGARVVDLDTSGTTFYGQVVNLVSRQAGTPTEIGVAAAPLRVDPTGTTTQPVSGSLTNISGTISLPTGASTSANQSTEITSLQLLDDIILTDNAAFTDGTTKLGMAGYILDDTAGTALTENDVAAPRISTNRATVGVIEDGATRARYATVTAANALKVDGSAVTQPVSIAATVNTTADTELPAVETPADNLTNGTAAPRSNSLGYVFDGTTWDRQKGDSTNGTNVQGASATDAAVSGAPVYIGGRASANEPAPVSADADVVPPWYDRYGRLVVVDGHPNSEPPVSVNATASGNTTVIAAPGASIQLCIQKGSVHNRAATNRLVALQDGAGGTTRWRAEVANEGGGSLFDFGNRGWCLTANTLLNANLDAAGDIDVNVTEYYIMTP